MAIAHFLIGTPASGKSTLAKEMAQYFQNCVIVSTDAIRQQIFSEPMNFGNWDAVSTEVLKQVQTAIATGQTVIYDATNAKRAWRINILQKFKAIEPSLDWIGWYIQTSKELCQEWNSQRSAQVPSQVIDTYHDYLKTLPPDTSEGLSEVIKVNVLYTNKTSRKTICIKDINGNWDLKEMEVVLQKLPRSIVNRKVKEREIILHQYSAILDFDRLMFILSLLLRYAGLGIWHIENPDQLREIIGLDSTKPLVFANEAEEICAVLSKEYDPLYADPIAVQEDLKFLQAIGMINSPYITSAIAIPPYTGDATTLSHHQYSDHETCSRILTTLRFIAHHPFRKSGEAISSTSVQERLINNLKSQIYMTTDTLRKDIENIFKPYQLFPKMDLRKGYFVGTSIFQTEDLKAIFHVMQSQVKSLRDPIALATYDNFCSRLKDSQVFEQTNLEEFYPVRAISSHSIIDVESLKNRRGGIYDNDDLSYLETAIEKGELLELRRFNHSGRFGNDPIGKDPFMAYPLQIVFDKIAWYLGFECQQSNIKGLFRYERLDRLAINHKPMLFRDSKLQRKALTNLQKLTEASYSLFLGNSYQTQQQIIEDDSIAEITIEFHCNDYIFAFLAEGSLRFPKGKMQMSPPIGGINHHSKKIYSLAANKNDSQFPHRFRVTLPKWVDEDVSLMRWLSSYGNQIRIVSPKSIRDRIIKFASEICDLYGSDKC
jgi:predicted kinase